MSKFQSNLRPITDIPIPYRKLFSNYTNFNSVQSQVIEDVLNSNKSIVVSAPTGSGKTVIFELAIVSLLIKYGQYDCDQHPHYRLYKQNIKYQFDFKTVYIAPIKALCNEKYVEWCEKFHEFGVNCLEITGDTNNNDELKYANIIITTPEKWNFITQKWKENEKFFKSIELFMIDEVHLLNDDSRGPILEAIVAKMKTIQYFFEMKIQDNIGTMNNFQNLRFIALSATIPNIEDIALWLGEKDSICYHKISENQRPVTLQKYILGFNNNLTGFKFDMNLNYKLPNIIRKYSNGKPTLIFCNSRKSVEMTTSLLAQKFFDCVSLSDNQKATLRKLSKRIHETKLRDFIQKGFAYHHAGLNYEDRGNIEKAFRKSLISILVSTNTLAMGVNLPVHLVIIKSTETYSRGSYVEYSENTLLQMIGRAGRPQYDENGVAVIMTHQKNVQKYENLINGSTPIESNFEKQLAEHLNSEIVSQTIIDLELAIKWIKSTYFYVRVIKCPTKYGFKLNDMSKENIEKKLEELCLEKIKNLEVNGLIIKDQALGISLAATQYGRLMAKYYLSFETMKLFRTIRGNETLLEMLSLIIHCKEYSECAIRVNDKKILNDLNEHPIRYPIKGKIKTKEHKTSCLIQAILGNIVIPEISLIQDALRMMKIGERISKCLSEFIRLLQKQSINNNFYKAILNSTILSKCFQAKLWENSEYISKQLKNIGPVYSSLLVNAGKNSLNELKNTDPRTIEMILGKTPPFGNEVLEALNNFPDYWMDVRPKRSNLIEIEIHQENISYNVKSNNGKNCALIVGDTDNNVILFNDKIDHEIIEFGVFKQMIKVPNPKIYAIYIHLIHDTLVGVDRYSSVILNPVEINTGKNQTKSKKKIQTKLQVTNYTNNTNKSQFQQNVSNLKTKNSNSILNDENLNRLDEVISIIDTEHYENTKENQNNCCLDIKLTNNGRDVPIKRKFEDYKYVERPKINKILNKSNDKNNTDEGGILIDEWILNEFKEEFWDTKTMCEKKNPSIAVSLCPPQKKIRTFTQYMKLINNSQLNTINQLNSTEEKKLIKTDSNTFVTIRNNWIMENGQNNFETLFDEQQSKLVPSSDSMKNSKYFPNDIVKETECQNESLDFTTANSRTCVDQIVEKKWIDSNASNDNLTNTELSRIMGNFYSGNSKQDKVEICKNKSISNFPSEQLSKTNFENSSVYSKNMQYCNFFKNKKVANSLQNDFEINEHKTKFVYDQYQSMYHENVENFNAETNEKKSEYAFPKGSNNFIVTDKTEKKLTAFQFWTIENICENSMVIEKSLYTEEEDKKKKSNVETVYIFNESLLIPSVYEIFKQSCYKKSPLIQVLESICDKNLSENHKKENPHEIINLFRDFDSEILSIVTEDSITTEFLQRGFEDKVMECTNKIWNQSTDTKKKCIQIVRVPDEKQTTDLNFDKNQVDYFLLNTGIPNLNVKGDDNNYFKISKDNLKLLDYNDNLNGRERKYNPYRLQLHQRQKFFTISKTDQKMKIKTEKIKSKMALETIKTNFKEKPGYKEEYYFKDVTKCLFADLNNVKKLISDELESVLIKVNNENRSYFKEIFDADLSIYKYEDNIRYFPDFQPLNEIKNEIHKTIQSSVNQIHFDNNFSMLEQESKNLFPKFESLRELKSNFTENKFSQNDNEFTSDIRTKQSFQSFIHSFHDMDIFTEFLKLDHYHKSDGEVKEEFPIKDEFTSSKNKFNSTADPLNFTQDFPQHVNEDNFFLF